MKKFNIIKSMALVLAGATLSACHTEDLKCNDSVIVTSTAEKNDFDRWLDANYVKPYNIDFMYRYQEIQSDYNYYTVPADYNQAIELAHVVKYICIDSYNEVAGVDFTRKSFPKEFYLIGEWEYNNNGTFILGTAEGGKKILLSGVNYFDQHKGNINELTYYYLKTIHHELTHILNQTKPMPTDFQYVSKDTYIGDEWSTTDYVSASYYLTHGHITAYSQKEYAEDFAEMMSMYVCYSEDQWNAWMEAAGTDGAAIIEQKLSIVKQYMLDEWNIDMDQLRNTIQRRSNDLKEGKVDLMDLSIN